MRSFDVIVIGAGAAGMMCAIEAGKRGRKVVLIDHSEKIGRKILISGGGRCNFTNIHASPGNFISKNPHFCKSALSCYTPQDFIDLVKRHGIKFHEKKLGQLFCDQSAQQIVKLLVDECNYADCYFQLRTKVKRVTKEEAFIVETDQETFLSQSLVIATGGLSIPQIGATGFGYDMARQFGLKIIATAPALDGFKLNEEDLRSFSNLAGVSFDAMMSCGEAHFRENILFTHNGLSGPASLQCSLYWYKKMPLFINVLPDLNIIQFLQKMRKEKPKTLIKNILAEVLAKRFAEEFCIYHKLNRNLAEMSNKEMDSLAEILQSWQIFPAGTVGYKKAEVTKGGISTEDLSSQTMGAKKVPGLYFIGEVVDVTGQLGGYNFQWAWASGYAAGQYV